MVSIRGNAVLPAISRYTNESGITASTNQAQGQQALTGANNEISTVANDNDVVTLPPASAGRICIVVNNGAKLLQIFPASGDNLGAGANLSTTLEINETVTFIASDATNWDTGAVTQVRHAEMTDNENTDAYVITKQNNEQAYHSNGLVTGDLGGGWTFDAGGAGTSIAIDSITDGAVGGGATDIAVTCGAAHGLEVGDIISQSNLTDANYTGHFKVKAKISDTVYEVAADFGLTNTGTMDQAATLICPTGGTGTYLCMWSCDATTATNNEVFDFALHLDEIHQAKSNARRKFGTAGDIGSVSKVCLLDITEGDKISFMAKNTSGTGNITIRNLNVVLVRL